ncbi:DNA (cytosine-5-)-methyltransferase [Streptococcus bovimastitidis]|uniref:Cytosine-specific methyltransferase n=1 Tax=Streptococcus bovimastitidis TaxID=1856638 RepID=A0A1L8MMM9_9STRE|nr:DNA (cytosine-5-)-methyltransferase [Streptococcus bovimastitidis]OJF72008.1 DNA (cytosine-5-)-methyltransferase [Streptococcus bovimastitidis]
MLKVVEAFSGIGAQKEALERAEIEHEILRTIEWDINAIYAYDVMHHSDLTPSELSKDEIVNDLANVILSSDGKKPLTQRSIRYISESKLKRLHAAIVRNKNLCDITKVVGEDIPENTDLITYSFPCQDLSNGSAWYNKDNEGIKKGAETRSGLLWEIERILKEKRQKNMILPRFLLMENVNAITSPKHNENFLHWQKELESLGYVNKVYRLNALNFGVPQSRSRTFMLSVRYDGNEEIIFSDLESYKSEKKYDLSDYLRLDNISESIESIPNYTPSRAKIRNNNIELARDNKILADYTKTISTKQDRNPNAGIIMFQNKMRYLTPRETFLLMGFTEKKFDKLKSENIKSQYLSNSHFYKMSGNSIVVDVLVQIFLEIERINGVYFNE